MALRIEEVPIPPRVVNSIQLSLPHEQISFSQRPGLRHCQTIELVTDLQELIVGLLESFIDLSLSDAMVSPRASEDSECLTFAQRHR